MLVNSKNRIITISSIIVFIFLLLSIRTGYVALVKGTELSTLTEKQYTVLEPISNINYSLRDYKGREMLSFIPKYYFVLDKNSFLKNNFNTDISLVKSLVYILRNYNQSYDLLELTSDAKNQKQYFNIDEDTFNKIREIHGIKGVYCFKKTEVDRSSAWTYENMLSNFSGTASDDKIKNSIEGFIYSKIEKNEFPKIAFEKDLFGELNETNYIIPKDNRNIRLTSDKDIQDDIKDILIKSKYEKYDQIGVVITESSSGKIISMVQKDDTKPNINLCSTTENGFQPGSIFKTIIASAALDIKGISVSYKLLCEETKKQHGFINMNEAYTVSCNNYFQKIGAQVKFDNVISLAKSFGLFNKVLNFSGNNEVTGDYIKDDITNISIGQSMRITPLQALGMVNTIVNDGIYIKPYLIDSLIDDEDNIIEKYTTESHRAIKSSTSKLVKNQMLMVVNSAKGTGRSASIPGIEIGGKTGTSERHVFIKNTNISSTTPESYIDEKHSDGWFTGFFKANDKYYSMVVFVNDIDPHGEDASTTAVPIFKDIVEKIHKSIK